jgi:hypothetical protein
MAFGLMRPNELAETLRSFEITMSAVLNPVDQLPALPVASYKRYGEYRQLTHRVLISFVTSQYRYKYSATVAPHSRNPLDLFGSLARVNLLRVLEAGGSNE